MFSGGRGLGFWGSGFQGSGVFEVEGFRVLDFSMGLRVLFVLSSRVGYRSLGLSV